MGVSDEKPSGGVGRTVLVGGILDTIANTFQGAPLCFAAVLLAALFGYGMYSVTEAEQERQQARFTQLLGLCWNNAETTRPVQPH